MSDDQRCPICGQAVVPTPRYPRYVCATCQRKAAASDGRPLRFFNLTLTGGFGAEYADNGDPYASHECYIDGVKCVADEAYLGGIVVQTAPR
jgi:hypothetical protein